ncbi:MAG: VWA domain-containing protein [Acidobacteriaceae bacterium]|jgi:VWFA-related protein
MSRSARFFHSLILIAATALPGLSQRTPPSSTPIGTIPDQPAQPGKPLAPIQTLKAAAQLVIVDVVVTDSKQTPVHNLKASDFSVLENNAPQQIGSFEEHTAPPLSQMAKVPPVRLPPGIFTNFTPVQTDGPINILLLDALNTQMKDQSYVQSQLREFVKNTPVGTRVGIFVLNDRLVMLQGVTSDLALLKTVVERASPGASILLGDSTGDLDNVGNGGTKTASATLADIGGPDTAMLGAQLKQAEATLAADDTQNRALQTLNAMNELAHYLGGIPGRKNLIWFSGSFPLSIFPDSTILHPFAVVNNMDEEYRETANLLARSQVAVYPIDARGLKTNATAIAKDSGAGNVGPGLASAQNKLFQDNSNENATMYQMASDTGGQAYINTNGLSEAVNRAITNGSSYYTLSYTPTNSEPDGKFRKIQVKLARPGLTLAYRSGYFADQPPSRPKSMQGEIQPDLPSLGRSRGQQPAVTPTGPATAQPGTLTRTMMHGAPNATEIMLKLQVLPASTATENAVVPGNIFNANPLPKVKIKGPFRRYVVDIAADAKDIHITQTPDGHFQFLTEVFTSVYDANGVLVNTALEKAHGNLSLSSYANMRRTGLPFHQEVSVPVDGDYYLRISVHDLETDHYGSVEVPVESVAKLPPLAASATPAARPR